MAAVPQKSEDQNVAVPPKREDQKVSLAVPPRDEDQTVAVVVPQKSEDQSKDPRENVEVEARGVDLNWGPNVVVAVHQVVPSV